MIWAGLSGTAALRSVVVRSIGWALFASLSLCFDTLAQSAAKPSAPPLTNLLVMVQGKVEVALAGSDDWSPGRINQILHPGDRVRTGERSRAEVYLANGMTVLKGEFSDFAIPPTSKPSFLKGLFNLLNRGGKPSDYNLPSGTAGIRGTDFLIAVNESGDSELTVLDGEVLLSNSLGTVLLTNRERGLLIRGEAPRKTSVLEATKDLIEWSLYYPGVLNADELAFTAEERRDLADSLSAYRDGDLLRAVADYSWSRTGTSDAEAVYKAALLLCVGQVKNAEALLRPITALPLARALKKLITAVKFEVMPVSDSTLSSSSEWLAESYYRQSQYQLGEALAAARIAASNAPNFGFAWARVAELEFSFGRTDKAAAALEKSLALSPRNAQAVALKGFLLAAQVGSPGTELEFAL